MNRIRDSLIPNPAGREARLPTRAECEELFARYGRRVVDYEDRRLTTSYRYPAVNVLLDNGQLFNCDLLHGGGLLFEED